MENQYLTMIQLLQLSHVHPPVQSAARMASQQAWQPGILLICSIQTLLGQLEIFKISTYWNGQVCSGFRLTLVESLSLA